MHLFKKIVFFSLLLLCKPGALRAAEETYFNELRGTNVVTGKKLYVTDEKFKNYTSSEWGKLNIASVKNYVSFELNMDTSLYFFSKPFSATVNVTIHFYADQSDTSSETSAPQTIDLSIKFDTARGSLYKAIALYKFQGAYKFRVDINSISSPELGSSIPSIFRLTGKTIIQRQYLFDDNSTDISVFNFSNPNQLMITWTPANYPGAESFDVEWTVFDSLSVIAGSLRNQFNSGQTFNTIPVDTLEKWFKNNSTRITTSGNNYMVNIASNSGFLLYRIRGVQINYGNELRYEGNWNYQASASPGGTSQYGVVPITWHQSNLNWQYSASFAEDGKRKEVIQYFDGTLRNRQAVTLDNSNQVAVVQESIYDVEGRVAASILPSPVSNNILQYYPAFNRNQSGTPYSFIDLQYGNNCRISAGILSELSGAAQYYSANNPFTTLHRNYIPSANGYPVAVTEYTPDNTGRIASQGGVGVGYQQGSGHETRYFYGKPLQTELDRLFGNEAGNASHYLKNMVVDPNGQISVSYVNASGKTIATALAGKVPDSLSALTSSSVGSTRVTNELIGNEDMLTDISNYRKSASATFTAPVTGDYLFNYLVQPRQLTQYHGSGNQFTICSSCYYDLKIEVKDNCNVLLQNVTRPAGLVFDPSCGSFDSINGSFTIPINTIGEYHVSYELVMSRNALNYYDSLNLATNTNIRTKSSFVLEELDKVDFTNCYNNCETCLEDLGSQADFVNRFRSLYLADSLVFSPQDSTYIAGMYQTQLEKCNQLRLTGCQKSPCADKLNLIKADVIPGSQYALYDSVTMQPVAPLEINILSRYTTVQSFPDENGNRDSVTLKNINGEDSVRLPVNQLTIKDFIRYWKASWADSLARFHPEYCYYLWCTSQSQYYAFDEMIKNAVTKGSTAVSNGYYSTTDYTALLRKDPFFDPANHGNDSAYYLQMQNKLKYLSRSMVGLSQEDRNILDITKILLYCKNSPSPWEGCQVDDSCRSMNREWDIFKQLYLSAKEELYERARLASSTFATCTNCYIGKDILQQSLPAGGITIKAGRIDTATQAYFTPPVNCVNGCADDTVYQDYNRPGISYYVKTGTRTAMPVTAPTGYTNGAFYAAFSVPIGSQTSCSFYNVWVFVKDQTGSAPVTAPPASSCSDDTRASLYVNKTRLFPAYVNNTQLVKEGLGADPQVAIEKQKNGLDSMYAGSCIANADAWIASLANCVHSGNAETDSLKLNQLKKEFIKICTAGSIAAGVNGASSVPDTSSLTYHSFEAVIKGILGDTAINSQCAIELLSGAYAYNRQPVKVAPIISETNADICAAISQYRSSYTGSGFTGSFYQYLVNTIGRGFTLTAEELTDMVRSCSNCNNILNTNISLPAALMGGRRIAINCSTADSLKIAFTSKFPGISAGNYLYELLITNFCNQALGYSLSYDDYQTFFANTCPVASTALLYDVSASKEITPDNNSCAHNLFVTAAANAKLRYDIFIDSVSADFREAYINRCMAAKASVKLEADLLEYHYTLYYYDQSGNLVKTVPPAGVVLLNQGQIDSVQANRQYARNNCFTNTDELSFNGTAAKSFPADTRFAMGTGGFSIETYLLLQDYNTRTIVNYTDTANGNGYKLQINGGHIQLRLQQNDTADYVLTGTQLISDIVPLNQWVHLVVVRTNGIRGTRGYIVLNGNLLIVSETRQNFNALQPADPTISTTNLLIGTDNTGGSYFNGRIKQLRLYKRALTVQEARQNYTNNCLMPAKQDGLVFWLPVNEGAGEIKDLLSAATSSSVNGSLTWISNKKGIYPSHTLITQYSYNSLNQVIQQQTPDAGISRFWYDRLGRLTASQNSEQLLPANSSITNRYSYTQYDTLGRITEVGEKTGAGDITAINTLDVAALQSWLQSGHNFQVTQTLYDAVNTSLVTINTITYNQLNLRKRVVSSLYKDDANIAGYDNATHYTYDINGNVKNLWQEVGQLRPYSDSGIKQVNYDYDLVSGKVNQVRYQPGKGDQFFYKYSYDAENRITTALSSRDGMIWATDAAYSYYLHGPLARTELGTLKVQGTDYAYTLQGWLKGMNTTNLNGQTNSTGDMGGDGQNSSRIAKDVAGFALHYNPNDYSGIASTAKSFANLPGGGGAGGGALYNGNIAAMSVNLANIGQPIFNRYAYDQLNRLVKKQVFTGLDTSNQWKLAATQDYAESLTYDANGNILTANRNGSSGSGSNRAMDALTYHYQPNSNKLDHVTDTVAAGNYSSDIDNQDTANYRYDHIGNLVADSAEGLHDIQWTVYGKIKSVTKTNLSLVYGYDAAGNRVYKKQQTDTSTQQQVYIRDAQGNTLAIYTINQNNGIVWTGQQLYGSSRLGEYLYNAAIPAAPIVTTSAVPTLRDSIAAGHTTYEITNHLGNVLATISDKKLQVRSNTDSTQTGYYLPEQLSAQDYYTFGMVMPGRGYSIGKQYRYGFNGKENDNEVKGEGNEINYDARIYDPRIGRFLSIDPLTKKYPWYTPYQFAGNKPIWAADLDGMEEWMKSQEIALRQKAVFEQSTSQTQYRIVSKQALQGLAQAPTLSTADNSFAARQRSGELKENQQRTDAIGGATMDPLAASMSYPMANAVGQYTKSTIQHGFGIYNGIKDGEYGEAAKSGGLFALDAAPFVPLKGFLTITTPEGFAIQSSSSEALSAAANVYQGKTLYKMGTFGRSEAAESQFWSLEDPTKYLDNPKIFADKYGIPAENLSSGKFFLIKGQLKPNQNFITRPAPRVGNNAGGSIEVVTNPGAVDVQSFQNIKPKKG